jgi:hypothetical protein
VPGTTRAPAFQDALKRVLTVAEAAGLAAGILAPDAETARRYADQACASSASARMPPCSPSPADTPSTASTRPEHPAKERPVIDLQRSRRVAVRMGQR